MSDGGTPGGPSPRRLPIGGPSIIKPFIFQVRDPVKLLQVGVREGEDVDYARFMRKHMFFGVEARYNVGYGLWQNAVLTTFN